MCHDFLKQNKKNFLLVFNHKAGKGSSDYKKDAIEKYLQKNNCDYTIIKAGKLSKEMDFCQYDAVVAVGGDGTILKIIPFLANTDIKLGIIPCGTANLFAASLCIPSNIHKALDILLNNSTTKVDIGKAGNKFFALRIGIGFDADVVNGTKRSWKRKVGYLAYLAQGVINSFKLSCKSYKITIDDKVYEVNANSIIVANAGNMFKNLFNLAPSGSLKDGKLDISIILTKNLWEFLSVFIKILIGKHNLGSKVICRQARSIKIQSNYRNIHIDGEPFYNSDLDISILPNALMVVVP
ncbi:MAG: diacylglycerol kinase family lipid kinase [Candidatus Gastranaerophilales bacterium]|nr:diacylglycerol kinase family lipid kinase [Candidatus Gastranaerophilales bacterium]